MVSQSGDAQKFVIKETILCFGGLAAAKTYIPSLQASSLLLARSAPQTEAALAGLGLLEARDQLSKLFELLKQVSLPLQILFFLNHILILIYGANRTTHFHPVLES